jgi:drug/metabolite transporter (DMT)-like permease
LWKRRRREVGLIVALFAILAGAAFVVSLDAFLDQSRQALSVPPPEPIINVSQLLIRPFLVRAGLAALLVLPLVTARAKRFSHALKTYLLMLLAPAILCACSSRSDGLNGDPSSAASSDCC